MSILPRLPFSISLSLCSFLCLILYSFRLFHLYLLNWNFDYQLRFLTIQLKLKLLDKEIAALLDIYRGAAVRDPIQV